MDRPKVVEALIRIAKFSWTPGQSLAAAHGMVRLALWGLDPLTDTRNLEVGQTLIGWAAKEENAIRELPATDQYPASHWCIFCSGDQDWNVDTPIPHRPECPHKLSQKLQDGR